MHESYISISSFPCFLQCDSTFAKQLFSVLFRGIFSQIEEKLTEREAISVTSDIKSAVNSMVSSSTQFFPAFISSVEVCLLSLARSVNSHKEPVVLCV